MSRRDLTGSRHGVVVDRLCDDLFLHGLTGFTLDAMLLDSDVEGSGAGQARDHLTAIGAQEQPLAAVAARHLWCVAGMGRVVSLVLLVRRIPGMTNAGHLGEQPPPPPPPSLAS